MCSVYLVLLLAGICGVAAKGALHTASIGSNSGGRILTPQNNYNGWVNPEDLAPMPQCIAQQDQSAWLNTMTKCTSKQCTSYFGVICTHHQWLTQLSCLNTGFSSDVIKGYLSYCSRSILAKAQLYMWVRNMTGRTWLVDIGDANGLEDLSPASLDEGYVAVNSTYNAPKCLTGSISALLMEPFQHVMASCSFTSTTQHTGNTARPWEYSESLHSIIALDFETVGYNLTHHNISYGDYFDKECFCSAFTIDPRKEPCLEPGQLDLTRERLWMNATCGPKSLPRNWTDMLKTTEFAYIPIEDWHWPTCVIDMPKQVIELTGQCATDACELDASGYCKVKRAVDRACFCRNISYDACGGSCQVFEARIDYVKWLHDLCGSVQDWHGLPDNWHQLAGPTPLDMIPWRWTIKPSNKSTENFPSDAWKLGSFASVNIPPILAALISRTVVKHQIEGISLWHPHPGRWVFAGILIATLRLLANWFNAFLVQNTLGYKDVPVVQLMFLWCTMPGLAWLPIVLISVQPFEAMHLSAVASSLIAEMVLQCLSAYYMVLTVNYGWAHNFYFGEHSLYFGVSESVEKGRSAQIMYAGALLWLLIIILGFVQLMWAHRMNREAGSWSLDLPTSQRSKWITSNTIGELISQWHIHCTRLGERLTRPWIDKGRAEETPLRSTGQGNHTVYGTLFIKSQNNRSSGELSAEIYAVTAMSMPLLWIAQWLFWGGFIGLSSEVFCPPMLGVLTAVWIALSFAGVIVGAALGRPPASM
ncbi:hypothetical protein CC78DRAFT_567129 [Lojkania enalia]|uniref:Uncharacterized protein n=1 Tax=Lojkania enalia TaxID=147567 RepID=A0A9P4N8Q6_9PLEO|nr:hypothetical protein CC78DRAFT_567129 [Didymosphaeria enalia]